MMTEEDVWKIEQERQLARSSPIVTGKLSFGMKVFT